METPTTIPLVVLLATLFVVGVSVYNALVRRVVSQRAHVRVSAFNLTDLGLTIFLTGLLGILIVIAVFGPVAATQPINPNSVLPSSLTLLVPAVALAAYMHLRGASLAYVFGLYRLSLMQALLRGLGLVIAAFPLVFVAAVVTQTFLEETGQEQELVTLFRDMVRNGNQRAILQIGFAGVILAPLSEEFLFRGYFYGTLKRYCGGWVSALFTAALFAAMHMNLASSLSLFVLALCLTVAYEATGCLLVPMIMHGMFNGTQLLQLYWNSQTPL